MSVWNEFDPLESVVVGNLFPTDQLLDALELQGRWRDAMQFINNTALQELQAIKSTLSNLGVQVHQCEQYPIQGVLGLRSPPLAPRDWFMIYGDRCLEGNEAFQLSQIRVSSAKKSYAHITVDSVPHDNIWSTATLDQFDSDTLLRPYLHTAAILRCGHDIFVSNNPGRCGNQQGIAWLRQWLGQHWPDTRLHLVNAEEHLDGSLFFIRPGLVLTSLSRHQLPDFFDKWQVIEVQLDDYRNKIYQDKLLGHVWKKLNPIVAERYSHFLQCNPEETMFSINALSVNHNCVLFPGEDPRLFDQLERLGIECISVDMRALSFWDSGLHCCTSELSRLGELQDYSK